MSTTTTRKSSTTRKPATLAAESVETVETVTPDAETVETVTTPDAFGFTSETVTVETVESLVLAASDAETTRVDAGIVAMIAVRRAVDAGTLTFEGEGTLARKVSRRWTGLGKESAVNNLLAVAGLMLTLPGATPAAARASHSALGWGMGVKEQRKVMDLLSDDEKGDAETVVRTFEAARDAARDKKVGAATEKRAAVTPDEKKEQGKSLADAPRLAAWEAIGARLIADISGVTPDVFTVTSAERQALSTIAAWVEAGAHLLGTTVTDLAQEEAADSAAA